MTGTTSARIVSGMAEQEPQLRRVIYTSVSELPASRYAEEEEIARMLATSRRNNARHGLTGALLYGNRRFAQVLEGPPDGVAALLDALAGDPRHSALTVLDSDAIGQRCFGAWTMAYLSDMDLIPPEMAALNESLGLLLRLRAVIGEVAPLPA